MSYEAWNLALFVFLQPILIIVFAALWWHERSERSANMQQRPLGKKM